MKSFENKEGHAPRQITLAGRMFWRLEPKKLVFLGSWLLVISGAPPPLWALM